MIGGVSPETFWAIKKHWNNKLYYTVASCWFFLLVLKYIGVVNLVVWLHMLSGPCWCVSAALFETWMWELSLWYNLKLRKSHNGPLSGSLTVFPHPLQKYKWTTEQQRDYSYRVDATARVGLMYCNHTRRFEANYFFCNATTSDFHWSSQKKTNEWKKNR
jgi:hypothetical protein